MNFQFIVKNLWAFDFIMKYKRNEDKPVDRRVYYVI